MTQEEMNKRYIEALERHHEMMAKTRERQRKRELRQIELEFLIRQFTNQMQIMNTIALCPFFELKDSTPQP